MKNAFKKSNFSKLTHALRITLCALLVAMLIVPFVLDNSRDAQLFADITDSESVAEASIINYAGQTSASKTSSAVVNVDGKDITISLSQSLKDNGDGTYTLELTPQASFSHVAYSDDSNVAKCGYFEAPANGTYVFEVWGGDGGIGENTNKSNGGQGGKGGYLNAELTMTAGDIIFYTIGGDGQATASPTYGGGANGDGGDHGESGRYMVGGGGGFTAVYYFSKGTQATSFKSKYMSGSTLTSSNLDEPDRTSKYIMIAGGGGGGGAGNSISGAVRTPDGGNAGNMTSASGKITASLVPGTYYAGENGKSSGDSQDYVGVGGSNVPGEEKSTKYDWYTGKTANNWEGDANPDVAAGTGGAGNLRGGAGGAGFCGGSGGIMRSLVIGANVGGGGGGSSFIADTVSSVTNTSYLTNNNTSKTGGAVSITYVPTANELNTIQNLKLEGTVSSYFNITEITTSDSAIVTSGASNSIVVTGVNALYKDESNKETTITIKLKPTVSTSMGGNDVPIYATDGNKITFTKSDSTSYTINTSDDCSYVNIPYGYKEITTYEGSTSAVASALFKNAGYTTTDFITFGGYSVTDGVNTYTDLSTSLTPEATTVYTISYTVSPKTTSNIKAVVGDILVQKTYSATAKIIVAAKNVLNDNTMEVTKYLTYASNVYTLSVNVKTNGTYQTTPAIPSEAKYTIPLLAQVLIPY